MVALVELAPVPTVCLFLTIPVPLSDGGWAWGELPRFSGVLAREYVYNAAECAALVATYGRMLAVMIRTSEADRYCITARGRITGTVVRRAEWAWNEHARSFVPNGEAWDGWRAAARAYWEVTGELISSQRFETRSGLVVAHSTVQQDRPAADILPLAPAA